MNLVREIYETTPRDGITVDEDQDIRNFLPGVFTIVGETDSVPVDSSITVHTAMNP
jgi:hypothetical protein